MRRGGAAAVLATAVIAILAVTAAPASAEHRASRATFNKIARHLRPSAKTIEDHLASVWVSNKDHGPWALAHEKGGEGYRELLRYRHGHWRDIAVVSVATGLSCRVAPPAVRRDLRLLHYTSQHVCQR